MNVLKSFDIFYQPRAGALLLRWSLALMILLHGIAKLIHGLAFVKGLLADVGLLTFLAYGAFIGEVVAPLLLLAGVFIVPAALVVAFNMVVAILLAHSTHLFQLTKVGGWAIELQAFYLITALVIALTTPPVKRLTPEAPRHNDGRDNKLR